MGRLFRFEAMRKKILIIHPEGNINNNPNLTGLVEILTEAGLHVDIKCPRKGFAQRPPCSGGSLLFESFFIYKLKVKLIDLIGFYSLIRFFIRFLFFLSSKSKNYDFIIGVDRYGVIEASILGELSNVPFGFISYEIEFADEVGLKYKKIEKKASQEISFAIVQDHVRGSHLSRENGIPCHKMTYIPVAGRFAFMEDRQFIFHEKLGIERSKKIALFAGSLAKWGMIDEIVQNLPSWPDDWVLVLHDRFAKEYSGKLPQELLNRKLFISNLQVGDVRMLRQLINSADIGIAFYRPDYQHSLTGNNLKYLGLSSGKISTYLQCGLPVITNEIGIFSEIVESNGLGFVIKDTSSMHEVLCGFDRDQYSRRCLDFFSRHLDLNNYKDVILNLFDLSSIN